jgi:hypothetical protein
MAGAKKTERVNSNHPNFQKIASYGTASTFRAVWENFFHYLREHWNVKDAEKITGEMVAAYMDYKSEYHLSKQYLEKISSALGKLEIALKHYTKNKYGVTSEYDFSIRQVILDEARDLDLVADNYHNRAYKNPLTLIRNLRDPIHRLAATIQLEGGARIEGIALIKPNQLRGIQHDPITRTDKGIVFTKEKGGKEKDVLITLQTYTQLDEYFTNSKVFKINRQKYYNDIRQATIVAKESPEASHGLRWNFAKRRMFEFAKAGYSYENSLQQVSYEMKHNRASITEHYLGG